MECLRSFNLFFSGQANWTGSDVKTWFVGAQEFWSYARSGALSTYNVDGFKNINVYGLDLIGNIGTLPSAPAGGCIPSDWSVQIEVNGFVPIIGGSVEASPNGFNLDIDQTKIRFFDLGRFKPNFNLASPIESVKSIKIRNFRANGTGGQTSGNLNLQYGFNIIVYYKFEGE
jgi:hypothetical protein